MAKRSAHRPSQKKKKKKAHGDEVNVGYIWVLLNENTGATLGVWEGGTLHGAKEAKRHRGKPGRKKRGDKTNGGKKITTDPVDKQVLPTSPVGDPCCYRDSATGEEWCWC